MTAAAVSAIAALVVSAWLLRLDGAFDTYKTPLFWPFLFAAGLVTVFSTTDVAGDTRGWRALMLRIAAIGAVIAGLAALNASRNPIYGLYARDVVSLASLEAALILAAGFASELGQRYRPDTWIRSAWCAAAAMAVLAFIPRLLLLLH